MPKEKSTSHWCDAILRRERKLEQALARDVDHTLEDMQRLEGRLEQASDRHPYLMLFLGVLGFLLVLLFFALAQHRHNTSTFGPGFQSPQVEKPLVP